MDDKNNKTLGYRIGEAVGIVLVLCTAALAIALTVSVTIKFITMIF